MGTFITIAEQYAKPIPTSDNLLEPRNRQLRSTLRNHNGLSLEREIQAICRWSHQHTPEPESDAWPVKHAYSDAELERPNTLARQHSQQGPHETTGMPEHHGGTAIDWNELHTPTHNPTTPTNGHTFDTYPQHETVNDAGFPRSPQANTKSIKQTQKGSKTMSWNPIRGAREIRTPDPLHAMEMRYQLRHSPGLVYLSAPCEALVSVAHNLSITKSACRTL